MVTILPIDVDEDFVREGLAHAVGSRLYETAQVLSGLAVELQGGGLIPRGRWARALAQIASVQRTLGPILEYAQVFEEQWPDDGESPDAPAERE